MSTMKNRTLLYLAASAIALPAHADQCAGFAGRPAIDGVRLTHAEAVDGTLPWTDRSGKAMPAQGAPLCRVRGVIEQEIGFELWLPPAAAWNGKLLAAGVGGEAGTLNYADMARGVRRGYASASTDTGHRIEDQDWALGRPDRRANFAARANHLLAEKSRALIAAYYGAAARRAYFIGCSGGGREALKEVQAYPGDFDGVLAGGAGPDQLAVSMRLLWSQYVVGPRVSASMHSSDWRLVADAATQACDAADGVRDGVVENPAACRFDPAVLQCRPGQADGCLSDAQLDAVRTLYAPLKDESGRALDEGVLPGVPVTLTPRSAFAYSLFGKVVHGDANWDPATLNIARDHAAARAAWPDLPNDRADIGAFRARGGKLIYYHGWLDPWILAQLPVNYFRQVNRQLGDTGDFFRLFMVPGMGHCHGGAGADQFGGAGGADAPVQDAEHDMLSALEAWVERGQAPRRIVASRVEAGRTTRTHPLCPYPQQAVHRGLGDGSDANNFECKIKENEQ
ncbi:MAG: tannase/feruloyl esterase family alpha/beta hydrolase [Pseudomonadota bacterium]